MGERWGNAMREEGSFRVRNVRRLWVKGRKLIKVDQGKRKREMD